MNAPHNGHHNTLPAQRITFGDWQIIQRPTRQCRMVNVTLGIDEVYDNLMSALYQLRAWFRRNKRVLPSDLVYLATLVRSGDTVETLAEQSMMKQPFQEAIK